MHLHTGKGFCLAALHHDIEMPEQMGQGTVQQMAVMQQLLSNPVQAILEKRYLFANKIRYSYIVNTSM